MRAVNPSLFITIPLIVIKSIIIVLCVVFALYIILRLSLLFPRENDISFVYALYLIFILVMYFYIGLQYHRIHIFIVVLMPIIVFISLLS